MPQDLVYREHLRQVEERGEATHERLVKRAAEEGVTRAKLVEMREGIERDIGKFRGLLDDSRHLA